MNLFGMQADFRRLIIPWGGFAKLTPWFDTLLVYLSGISGRTGDSKNGQYLVNSC